MTRGDWLTAFQAAAVAIQVIDNGTSNLLHGNAYLQSHPNTFLEISIAALALSGIASGMTFVVHGMALNTPSPAQQLQQPPEQPPAEHRAPVEAKEIA